MVTISFYSYKGGVGRSLTLANLGVYLAQFGATVVMVDFDLEAPGLHYKLRPDAPIEIPNRGLAGLLADVSRGRSLSEIDWNLAIDVSEHARPPAVSDEPSDEDGGRLYLIPAGNPMLSDYWNDLASIRWENLFVAEGRPGVFALSHLKEAISDEIKPDVLLVDSRTGITPGGGVSTTLLPDVVVTMMLNTAEHLDGSRLVISAVSESQRGDEPAPAIVPVLSRYTSAQVAERERGDPPPNRIRPRGAQLQMLPSSVDEEEEDIPLLALGDTLMEGLSPDAVARVKEPLVLHADPLLQQREYLTFGRYAQSQLGASGRTLFEDYLRLFAALVPEETFLKYMTGVRERARGILLDNPEDAVRSLESLVTLTGDEGAFSDLAKVYLLRREARKLVSAAENLYRVHDRIVPEQELTQELRNLVTGRNRAQRLAPDTPVSAAFAEAYWRRVVRDDVEFGGAIAKLYADRGDLQRGRRLAEEIIGRSKSPKTLADIVRILAYGGAGSEVVAVGIATDQFEFGEESGFFLSAAAAAARFQRDSDLAERIINSPGRVRLDPESQVRLLEIAGNLREAAGIFIEAFATSDPDDVDLDELHDLWVSLGKRVPEMCSEFRERNPALSERLDIYDENPF